MRALPNRHESLPRIGLSTLVSVNLAEVKKEVRKRLLNLNTDAQNLASAYRSRSGSPARGKVGAALESAMRRPRRRAMQVDACAEYVVDRVGAVSAVMVTAAINEWLVLQEPMDTFLSRLEYECHDIDAPGVFQAGRRVAVDGTAKQKATLARILRSRQAGVRRGRVTAPVPAARKMWMAKHIAELNRAVGAARRSVDDWDDREVGPLREFLKTHLPTVNSRTVVLRIIASRRPADAMALVVMAKFNIGKKLAVKLLRGHQLTPSRYPRTP